MKGLGGLEGLDTHERERERDRREYALNGLEKGFLHAELPTESESINLIFNYQREFRR